MSRRREDKTEGRGKKRYRRKVIRDDLEGEHEYERENKQKERREKREKIEEKKRKT